MKAKHLKEKRSYSLEVQELEALQRSILHFGKCSGVDAGKTVKNKN
jgi:hypothetical protein